jgi:LysR family glycine cleavage system transcriptional activator
MPDLRPVGTLQFEQVYFALEAAAEGLGVVLVPIFLAIDDIATGRLCTPFGTPAARKGRYHAIANARTPVIDDFVAWLVHEGRGTETSMALSMVPEPMATCELKPSFCASMNRLL